MPRCPEFNIDCNNAVFANEDQKKAPGCLMKNTLDCPPFVKDLTTRLREINWVVEEDNEELVIKSGRTDLKFRLRWTKGGGKS